MWNVERKERHINKCLDLEEQREMATAEEQFSLLQSLETCPCCLKVEPFARKRTDQKGAHLKNCGKAAGMTVTQIMRKLQWARWGLTSSPIPSTPTPHNPATTRLTSSSISVILAHDDLEDDDDFSNTVVVHRSILSQPSAKPRPRNNKKDEDLQLGLALSRSLRPPEKANQPRRRGKLSEFQRNAASIVTVEESRQLALTELDNVLHGSNPTFNHFKMNTLSPLPPSRLLNASPKPWYWTLASGETDQPEVYMSSFMKRYC